MKGSNIRFFIAMGVFILSIIIALYVSVWLMCITPILTVVNASVITSKMVIVLILNLLFATPVARIIVWLGGLLFTLIAD